MFSLFDAQIFLSSHPCFIPSSVLYPYNRVLSPHPCFIPSSVFYPPSAFSDPYFSSAIHIRIRIRILSPPNFNTIAGRLMHLQNLYCTYLKKLDFNIFAGLQQHFCFELVLELWDTVKIHWLQPNEKLLTFYNYSRFRLTVKRHAFATHVGLFKIDGC